jgi:phospholipid/cholesterol/gamma-HCH transport system substrate-binding protein
MQSLFLAIAVLFALGASAVGLFAVGNRQWLWQDTFHIRVGFTQIRGVEPGTRVRVQGRDAGEVETVQLPDAPGNPVTVRLRLDGKLRSLIRADATAQIVTEGMVGGKVVEIDPGSTSAEPIENDALIASRTAPELTDLLGQVGKALDGVSNGSLAKLAKDDEAYQELLKTVKQAQGAISSLRQNADAMKAMPIVRSYVKDSSKELIRPECERHRSWFHESELFEPGRAILTADGKAKLDEVIPWFDSLKKKNSEVVVASFADPSTESEWAYGLTQKQSESVLAYLTNHHRVQKMGWFSKRKVTAVGCGASPSPVPEVPPLPAPRVELLVFVPPQ